MDAVFSAREESLIEVTSEKSTAEKARLDEGRKICRGLYHA